MAGIGSRSKIYAPADVITITSTVAAGVTIQGEELYPFEGSGWGRAKVIMRGDSTGAFGDTITVKPYVSFDGGTTWDQVGAYAEFANGSGALGDTIHIIPFAPRLRVDLVVDSAGSLSANHGAEIAVEFVEDDPESKRVFAGDTDFIAIGDSAKLAGDSAWAGLNGETITVNSPSKVKIFATADDTSDITDTFTYTLQSSLDGSNWFTHSALTDAIPASGTGIFATVEEEAGDTKMSKYMRLIVTGDTLAALGSAHGIKYYFYSQE